VQQVGNEARWVALATPEPPSEETAQHLDSDKGAIGIRHDLVARVRREIAEGAYDTEERWEAALDRLSDRLHRE
jgi:hypothetical protein